MSDRRLSALGAMTIAVLFVVAMAAPGAAHAGVQSAPADSVPSEPPTTDPETTEPPNTEPPTTRPAESVDDGDDIGTAAAVLGILGFVALVGVAAWWMIRLGNEDDAPHPRRPAPDDPPPQQDLL